MEDRTGLIESTYKIIEPLGAGGGGEVYLAQHLRLKKQVVLKKNTRPSAPGETEPDTQRREKRLRREVEALKDLRHAYIPQVYDYIEEGDNVYTVIDYVQGESLDKALKREGHFSQPQVIEWACELLDALSYLHTRPPHGILHSDIKPSNIMLTPQKDIRLIDFDIAQYLTKSGIVRVGRSKGYASPEQNALYEGTSTQETSGFVTSSTGTGSGFEKTPSLGSSSLGSNLSASRERRPLDKRSDIYSVGATLYHLLTGRRPAKDVENVIPITQFKGISLPVARIVQKAMAPNPDQRYQSADEMREDFVRLRKRDPRAKRHHVFGALYLLLTVFITLAAISMTYIGLRQEDSFSKADVAAGESETALRKGDQKLAVDKALEALPERNVFHPSFLPRAQRALANALGVYDLSDGYKSYCSISLPDEPIKASLSPDGSKAVVLLQENSKWKFAVYNVSNGEQINEFAAKPSALSDFAFLDSDTLLYAGEYGLTASRLSSHTELYVTERASTAVCLSENRKIAATVYRDETSAVIWDTDTGTLQTTVDFNGKHMKVLPNDVLADPKDGLFVLNETGEWLAVSFSDGALWLFNTENSEKNRILFESSDYTHFEGGFYGNCFAFCADSPSDSCFVAFNLETSHPIRTFSGTTPFHVQADSSGVYLSLERTLVRIDPYTGEQTEVAYTESDIVAFTHTAEQTLVLTENQDCLIYDSNARLTARLNRETRSDFASIASGYVLSANRDEPFLQIHQWERHPEAQIFSYDASYPHNETRLYADRTSVMLYRYDHFRIIGLDGQIVYETDIPDELEVRKQLYHPDPIDDFLEVGYNNGLTRYYSAKTGDVLYETKRFSQDDDMQQTFQTNDYMIYAPLHGAPSVVRKSDGQTIGTLEQEAYLTYVTQVGDYIIAEYITAELERYGRLLNGNCEILADLPDLCDILPDGTLIFDDMRGNIRESKIRTVQELIEYARKTYEQ